MNKYFLVYYVETETFRGVNCTSITLDYPKLELSVFPEIEKKLKEALHALSVVVLSYKQLGE